MLKRRLLAGAALCPFVLSIAISDLAQAQVVTRQTLSKYNNSNIFPNSQGLVTPSIVNSMFNQTFNGMGVLGDTNAWTGANTFAQINNLIYVTGNTSSVVAAAEAAAVTAGVGLAFGPQAYDASGVTFTTPVVLQPGSVLNCATAQFSFTNTVSAPRNTIFGSGCTPSFFNDYRLDAVFPEWWGAAGDDTAGTSGTGTDNTSPIANALTSGARKITFGTNGNYRFSTIPTQRSNLILECPSRDTTILWQDDATGLDDGFFFYGHSGGITFQNCNVQRIQPGIGHIAGAEIVSGGTNCPVGTTLTFNSGTNTTPGVLTVNAASGGVASGNPTVTTPGSYTKAPPPTQTLTSGIPAVAPSSASGSCSGLTVKLLMQGPGLIHLQDTYFTRILDNTLGNVAGSPGAGTPWNGITIDAINQVVSSTYIQRNQIFGGENDGIYAYGPSSSGQIGDLFVDNFNYIQDWGRAGFEARNYVSGAFATDNGIYNNGYGFYWDSDTAVNLIYSSKIRANDDDSNVNGDYFYGVGTTQFENNWHSDTGDFVCTLCVGVDIKGGIWPSTGKLYFNGSNSIVIDTMLGGQQGTAITLNSYGGQSDSQFLVNVLWPFGSGYLFTVNDASASDFTVTAQINQNMGFSTGHTIQNLTRVGGQNAGGFQGASFASVGASPSVTSGTCSGSSITGGATAGTFIAATCAGGYYVLAGMPASPNGYACTAQDQTTPADTLKQTGNSVTQSQLTGTTASGDVIVFSCQGW